MGAGGGAHAGAGAVTVLRAPAALKVPLLVFALSALLLASSGDARAQEVDLFGEAACRENPNSEDCICALVRHYGYYPVEYTRNPGGGGTYTGALLAVDVTPGDSHPPPTFNFETGAWDGNRATPASVEAGTPDGDLVFSKNDHYNQQCALSYFREDLRRLWRFAVALGAALAAASVAWAGVVWMQESASGNDIARSRGDDHTGGDRSHHPVLFLSRLGGYQQHAGWPPVAVGVGRAAFCLPWHLVRPLFSSGPVAALPVRRGGRMLAWRDPSVM